MMQMTPAGAAVIVGGGIKTLGAGRVGGYRRFTGPDAPRFSGRLLYR